MSKECSICGAIQGRDKCKNPSSGGWACFAESEPSPNLQAAKPAEGSLPVVATLIVKSITGEKRVTLDLDPELRSERSRQLTDHAQATAEIAKEKELHLRTFSHLTAEIAKRDARIAELESGLAKIARHIAAGEAENTTLRAQLDEAQKDTEFLLSTINAVKAFAFDAPEIKAKINSDLRIRAAIAQEGGAG